MRTLIRTCITIILLCLMHPTHAQLCQGSLGDPIVNITFGSGPNPGPAFNAATTTYTYTSADCPTDGIYALRNSTTGCFGSWHSIPADHTGDPNGYFMLVNAAAAPSAFYLDTVRGLCSSTTFEFAAWMANVLMPGQGCQPSVSPNLTFTIERTDGTILQTFNTGNLPEQVTFTWQQMGFYFVTPPGIQEVVLRIVNNAPGGCGNDLALDDITFRPCGPTIMANIAGSPTTSLSFCIGNPETVTFTGNVLSGLSNPVLQWQQHFNNTGWQDIPGETNTTLVQNYSATQTAGTYQYRLTAVQAGGLSLCRTNSQALTITMMPTLTGTLSSNAPPCAGGTLQLSVAGTANYQWTGPNGFTATGTPVSIPNAQPTHAGKYYVEGTVAGSCPYYDSVTVAISETPVATVNGDTSVCVNDPVQLTSSGGTTYLWQPATGLSSATIANPVATLSDTTSYMVIVSTSPTCKDTAYVVINVLPSVSVNAGPDQYILKGETAILKGSVVGQNNNFNWSPTTYMTDATSLTSQVSPPADIDYILATPAEGACGFASDTVHIFVYPDIYIPNAFTPNGDGHNDSWRIPGLKAVPVFELTVYNRWGQLIYRSQNATAPWNGRFNGIDQPSGGYAYILNIGNGKRKLKGVVMLLR